MPASKKKNDKRRNTEDDNKVYRVVIAFVLALITVIALMNVREMLNDHRKTLQTLDFFKTAAPVFGALTLVSAATAIIFRTKKQLSSWMWFLTAVLALWAVSSFIVARYEIDAAKPLYIIIPCAAVLYTVSALYTADFTAVSAITAVGLLYCWVYPPLAGRETDKTLMFTASVLLAVVAAATLVLLFILAKNKGRLSIRKGLRLLPVGSYYPPLFLAAALLLAAPVVLLVTTAAAIYFTYLFLALFAVSAVIYTVRLI